MKKTSSITSRSENATFRDLTAIGAHGHANDEPVLTTLLACGEGRGPAPIRRRDGEETA
jgi:hypothetical protein